MRRALDEPFPGVESDAAGDEPTGIETVEHNESTRSLSPILEPPRHKGRRQCYSRCPNVSSQNFIACDYCRHKYHVECIGAKGKELEGYTLRCEFCPVEEATEPSVVTEERKQESTRVKDRRACPCGADASRDSHVKCYYCTQVLHASCAGVSDANGDVLFVYGECKDLVMTDSVDDHEEEALSIPEGTLDRCPCGKRFSLERLIKCRTCTQLFHERCVGAPVDNVQNFVCSDCIAARDLDDNLTARNAALRENADQEEIFEKLRLPNISPKKAEYARNFMSRMAGRESYLFEDRLTGGESDDDSTVTDDVFTTLG